MRKVIGLFALLLTLAACNKAETDISTEKPKATSVEKGITITAILAPKSNGTKAVSEGTNTIISTWAQDEKIAILYEVSESKYVAEANVDAVDGESGSATISFTVEDGTPDNTSCTLVYPASAAKGDHTGVKDAATLLAAQDGTLSANLDVRVGEGTIQTTTPSLDVTTQPAPQFAIFKFTTQNAGGTATIDVKPLTITIGAQNYVITPASATSTLYAALPAISSQAVSFRAKGDDSRIHTANYPNISFTAGLFYQSELKLTMLPPATGHILAASVVGEVVGTDGWAYAVKDKDNLPAGVTAAGMVAYRSNTDGLVIALADEDNTLSRGGAMFGAGVHTPAVAGQSWKLPSREEWSHIFNAYGDTWTALEEAIVSAGGTAFNRQNSKDYWTSTKMSNFTSDLYFYERMNEDGSVSVLPANTQELTLSVRACFYFELDRNAFSVSPTTKVTFAPGNLRYTGSKWEFLSNSWDCGYNGNHGKTSGSQYFAWNDVFKDASVSTASDIKDDVANDLGSTWRGLSTEEWRYLLGYDGNNDGVQSSRRAVAWHRYAMVDETKLGDGRYLLIFPDGFKESDWNTSTMGTKPTEFEQYGILYDSGYTTSNFTAMQDAGIVILPKSGCWLDGWGLVYEGTGRYWSSTCADASGAMALIMNAPGVNLTWTDKSEKNYPVRLVKNVE